VDEPPLDNTWLLQKHRDIIKDYTDVHPDEKEYVSEWDAFALAHKATLSPHLHDLYLEFLEEKALWLASTQNRMNEAMKHLAYLTAREALNDDTVSKALSILRTARQQARNAPPEMIASTQEPETRSSHSGCAVCGQAVPGPSQLICSNIVSVVDLERHCVFYSQSGRNVTDLYSTTNVFAMRQSCPSEAEAGGAMIAKARKQQRNMVR
jgi:hypothetical protein